ILLIRKVIAIGISGIRRWLHSDTDACRGINGKGQLSFRSISGILKLDPDYLEGGMRIEDSSAGDIYPPMNNVLMGYDENVKAGQP
ncbi:hypothetical protein ONR49_25215, partial [Salmonella enterica subsp. enterica serovar Virginia]|nr:hypothetical protein [Salmonella enterica subsp. enterica serovar Virginia]